MSKIEKYKNYIYLIGEALPQKNEGSTLLDVTAGSIKYLKNNHCYFSKNNNNVLRGFLAYADEDNYVKQIKMFSFDPNGDITFAREILKTLLKNYVKTIFLCHGQLLT